LNNKLVIAIILAVAMAASPIIFSQVQAQSSGDVTRMIWQNTRNMAQQRALADSLLDSNDMIIYHLPAGGTVTQTMLDTLRAVGPVPSSRTGFEFFSLSDIERNMPIIKADSRAHNNVKYIISYDLEDGASPDSESSDPVQSFEDAYQIVTRDNGFRLQAAPSWPISNQYAEEIADIVYSYHLQSQRDQADDTTCNSMLGWVNARVAEIESTSRQKEGKITYQVTLTRNAADGKTIYETAQDCIDTVSPSDIDGLSIWWGGASWDSRDYHNLLEYHEDRYS
jgi:hypothetical protein